MHNVFENMLLKLKLLHWLLIQNCWGHFKTNNNCNTLTANPTSTPSPSSSPFSPPTPTPNPTPTTSFSLLSTSSSSSSKTLNKVNPTKVTLLSRSRSSHQKVFLSIEFPFRVKLWSSQLWSTFSTNRNSEKSLRKKQLSGTILLRPLFPWMSRKLQC